MGYNYMRYARRVGAHVELKRNASLVSLPRIKLTSAGALEQKVATGQFVRYDCGGAVMWKLTYAGNVTTVEGGAVTGDDHVIKANSIDADNITVEGAGDIVFSPTGNVKFGTFAGTGDAVSNGSITIKDAGGTLRKLMTKA